ncbi:MAG: 5'(3')-deoxyribonucleotidase [Saprospiraceae bacterium]|nr:5'(3')-deoxyribonucleotidase [Saprospiraceae bacterium]
MRIIIDMDEVMADAYWGLVEKYENQFNTTIDQEQVWEKKLRDLIPEEHYKIGIGYLYEPGFFRNLRVIKGAQEVIKALWDKHEVFICSAAMQFPQSLQEKSDWLDEHFPFIDWKYRILCGHKYMIDADVMLDDHAYNLEVFTGPQKLLFTSPHNIAEERFTRVDNWEAAAKLLL